MPTSPSVMQMASQIEMQMMSGTSFDSSYIKDQIKAHEDTVNLFKKEIACGQDQRAKDLASSTLPTVHAHLTKIIAATAGVSTK